MVPLISVVMPAHNAGVWIRDALQSLQLQSFREWELLCVNNESSDETANILLDAAQRDPRITFLDCKTRGAWAARNLGLRMARAPYICFLDADDLYPDTEVLGDLFLSMQDGTCMVSGGSLALVHSDGNTASPMGIGSQGLIFEVDSFLSYTAYQFDFGYTRFLYQRHFLLAHKLEFPPYTRFEDPPFFVQSMIFAGRLRAMRRRTYLYRVDHKPLVWSSQNIADLLSALTDNLSLSHQHNLSRLHNLTVERLTTEYEGAVRGGRARGNRTILRAEARCLACIDRSMLDRRRANLLHEFLKQRRVSMLWHGLRRPRTIPARFLYSLPWESIRP
jgi:glycosyltransferase involved in cell wall biosynthesis